MVLGLRDKLFSFNRNKGDKSIVKTSYMKFLNFFMRKGLKTKYINFFYKLLRLHKKKLKQVCLWKYKSGRFDELKSRKGSKKLKIPSFNTLFTNVSRMITFRLELRYRKFRRKEILKPVYIAPWRGFRLGFGLLLKNVKGNLFSFEKNRNTMLLHSILRELWQTFYGISETMKNVKDFSKKVLENTADLRFPVLFEVRPERRFINPDLFFSTTQVVNRGDSKEKKLAERRKRKAKRYLRKRLVVKFKAKGKGKGHKSRGFLKSLAALRSKYITRKVKEKKYTKKVLTKEQGKIFLDYLKEHYCS